MKNIFTFILLLTAITVFSQTTMTVHTNTGATDYLLSEIDSITYDGSTGGGGGSGTYNIGDTGPAGGIVFYDKGVVSNGWRFLEVPSNDLNSSEWGCSNTNITGTSDAIGSGQANSAAIVAQCTTPGISAKLCLNYSVTVNGVVYNDWFLPSIEELNLLYNANQTQGSLLNLYSGPYWSSTQFDSQYPWCLIMSNGTYASDYYKGNNQATRAVRRF